MIPLLHLFFILFTHQLSQVWQSSRWFVGVITCRHGTEQSNQGGSLNMPSRLGVSLPPCVSLHLLWGLSSDLTRSRPLALKRTQSTNCLQLITCRLSFNLTIKTLFCFQKGYFFFKPQPEFNASKVKTLYIQSFRLGDKQQGREEAVGAGG